MSSARLKIRRNVDVCMIGSIAVRMTVRNDARFEGPESTMAFVSSSARAERTTSESSISEARWANRAESNTVMRAHWAVTPRVRENTSSTAQVMDPARRARVV